jgi:hypothetical protein
MKNIFCFFALLFLMIPIFVSSAIYKQNMTNIYISEDFTDFNMSQWSVYNGNIQNNSWRVESGKLLHNVDYDNTTANNDAIWLIASGFKIKPNDEWNITFKANYNTGNDYTRLWVGMQDNYTLAPILPDVAEYLYVVLSGLAGTNYHGMQANDLHERYNDWELSQLTDTAKEFSIIKHNIPENNSWYVESYEDGILIFNDTSVFHYNTESCGTAPFCPRTLDNFTSSEFYIGFAAWCVGNGYYLWVDDVEINVNRSYTCLPNYQCSDYDSCSPFGVQNCNATTDLNVCNITYTGDYSEFTPQSCVFSGFSQCNNTLSESGNYVLTQDLKCSGYTANIDNYIFRLNNSYITIDCDGHSLTSDNADGLIDAYFIGSLADHTTIKNCVLNVTGSTTAGALVNQFRDYWNVSNNTIYIKNDIYPFMNFRTSSPINNIVSGNKFYLNLSSNAMYLLFARSGFSCSPITEIYNNDFIFLNNYGYLFRNSDSCEWSFSNNTHMGNHYVDYRYICTDFNMDGFCDLPYNITCDVAQCYPIRDYYATVNYPFELPTNDSIAPNISFVFPVAGATYNKSIFPNLLAFTVSENSSCLIDSPIFYYVNNTVSEWVYNSNDTPVANYSIAVNCTDSSGNTGYANISFEVVEIIPPYVPPTGGNVTVSVLIDVPLIVVIILYIFIVGVAFLSQAIPLLIIAMIYGLYVGFWFMNNYPQIPQIIIVAFMAFNAYIIFVSVRNRKQ